MKVFITRKMLVLGVLFFISSRIFGQGTLQGIVTDSLTNESLFGASIMLVGTSQGAATNFNGEYKIANIPAGEHRIKVSYIGYLTKIIKILVKDGETLELSVQMTTQRIEGKTIVVTAQAQGQLGAINQQLSSNTITNVVSADKIRQLPDDNAATALSRLPGVSLMNGDQIVIRGVEAKLNQVLVNGIQMPSTDMNDRATNLGFISSNMLSGIEVIKAITPDMDANTVGGVVNLKLASAQPGLHFDVMAQGNYNSSDRTTDTYKFWASVSNRYFDDKLGVFLQGNADRTDGGNQKANITLAGPNGAGSLKYGQAVYITTDANFEYDQDIVDTRGWSIILDYKLPHGKIIMQNTYAATAVDQRNNINDLSFTNTVINYTIDRNKYGKELWINSLQAENSFGNVKVEGSLSHSYTDQYTKIAYQSGEWCQFENASSYEHPFGTDSTGKPIIYTSPAQQMAMPLSRTFGIFDNINPSDPDSAKLGGWCSALTNTFKQHLYNAALDVSVPVAFSNDITGTFKAGGKFIRTTRDNDFNRYFARSDAYGAVHDYFGTDKYISSSQNLPFDYVKETNFKRGKYFLSDEYNFKNGFQYVINTDIYDNFLQRAITGWQTPLKLDDSWANDFKGAETFSAGYAMATFNIFDNITLLGGVRFEAYNMDYHAQTTFITHPIYGDAISTEPGTILELPDNTPGLDTMKHAVPYSVNNVNRTDRNYFPDVQLKYKFNEWSDLRLAYTTGIARPDYSAIIPKVVVYPSDHLDVGNPLLRPTKARNVDAILSVFSNKIGLFTINGFYKELRDVIYYTNVYYSQVPKYYGGDVAIPDSAFLHNHFAYNVSSSNKVYTYLNNNNTGYIRGVEIDWQTNFWYLPQPLNALVLDVNYTKSASHLDYRILTPIPLISYDAHHHQVITYATRDTTFSGRLVQQANDVLNAAIGIDYKGFSGRLSFNMRGNVINYVGSRPEETSYTGNIYRWDFVVKQNLPVDGLSLSLNGVNIFHNAVRSYQDYRMNPAAPITQNEVSVEYAPTIFQMNIRYTF